MLGIPPLIVTLGTFGMALGLADVITGGVDIAGIPSDLGNTIGAGKLGPIPWLVVIAAVVTIVVRARAAPDPVRALHVRDRLQRGGRQARRASTCTCT